MTLQEMSVDKNIVPFEPAPSAGSLFYGTKFLSFDNMRAKCLFPVALGRANFVTEFESCSKGRLQALSISML